MTMRVTVSLLGVLAMFVACAEGEDDDDAAGTEESGSIGDDSGTTGDDSGTVTATTSATSVTGTTATTLTTDPGTTDTGPEDTGDTGDTGSDTTGDADLSCAEYCGIYLDACANFSEYANAQDCMDNCAQWPIGTAADTGADSLGCRIYHATVASGTDPDMHCPHAGPSGAATCVAADAPTCDLYCTRVFGNCAGDLNTFVDMADCMDQCGEWYPGTEADVDGHTVGCHSYHANAAIGDAETHCPHAAPGGGGICVL